MIRQKIPLLLDTLKTILSCSQDENATLCAQWQGHFATDTLINAGYIRPGEFAGSYWCDCGDGGESEVVWIPNRNTGTSDPLVRCEGCGLYGIEPQKLATWTVIIPSLIQRIGEAMGFQQPFAEDVSSLVWSFGRKMRREFYYVRCVAFEKKAVVKSFFVPHPTAVLIVPTNAAKEIVREILPNNLCFSAESVASFDEEYRLSVAMPLIEAELKPIVESRKKPAARRGNRAVNIEKLVNELKQHIIAARDHAWEVGELLPRPFLQDLGKLAGLEKHDVSRCMRDADAGMLRLLWKVAGDIKLVREWKG